MDTLVERALRSAAEDLGLSPDGWSRIRGDSGTSQAFRHTARPALVVEVSMDGPGWSWTASLAKSHRQPALGPAQPWACIDGLAVRVSPSQRGALLDALAIAGDNIAEANACSTAMLQTRLDVLVSPRGFDLFVAPVQNLDRRQAEPAAPLRLDWSYRGQTPDGDDVAGVVQGADEAEAIEAVERLWAGLDLMELSPRLAGLAPLSSAARRLAEDGLRQAGAQGPASGLPALH